MASLSAQTVRAPRPAHPHRSARSLAARPRLSVFRSDKNISAQVIDDAKGVTVAAASSLEKEQGRHQDGRRRRVGKLVAERAKKAGVTDVVFDRGGYIYHGRVKALADAAREAGLKF